MQMQHPEAANKGDKDVKQLEARRDKADTPPPTRQGKRNATRDTKRT